MSSDATKRIMESNRICFIKVIECLLSKDGSLSSNEYRSIKITGRIAPTVDSRRFEMMSLIAPTFPQVYLLSDFGLLRDFTE